MNGFPYTRWEDWLNGMYHSRIAPGRILAARDVLRDATSVRPAMQAMTSSWPLVTETQLTLRPRHRTFSWIGQATCCYTVGATALETRKAWGLLTDTERATANRAAAAVYSAWHASRTGALWGPT